MNDDDDYGIDDDDTELVAAATQIEAQNQDFERSPRPAKRVRTSDNEDKIDEGYPDGVESDSESIDNSSRQASRRASYNISQISSRQRRIPIEPEEDEDYYFEGELDNDEKENRQSKYKIHVPKNGGLLPNTFFTQTQAGLDEDPAAIRGPVWKRPPARPALPILSTAANRSHQAGVKGNIGSVLDRFVQRSGTTAKQARSHDATGLLVRNGTVASAKTTATVGPKTQPPHVQLPVDFLQDLEDLPSDAFSSSSPEKSPRKEAVATQSQVTNVIQARQALRGPQNGLKQMTVFGQPATQSMTASQASKKKHAWPLKAKDEPPTHHKLDRSALEKWVFPTNLGTIRDYQFNIVSRSLHHNTLVALPTGLGKTFIAATVMLNYYRWTTDSHILFMAPTKPLIAQQMEACYGIVGIPRRDTILMTGETTPAVRAEEWSEKRVFFMTPQTVINDLKTGICDPKRIVLVVVDEAHKSTGGYAYTEVVSFLRRFNPSFRVLALTATPGSTVEAVQAVIDNLGIARVELRTEQSLDIRQYTHEKHTETELFDFSEEQALIMEHVSKAIKPVLDRLNSQNAYWSKDPMALSAFGLQQARGKWAQSDAGRKAPMPVKGMINSIFTVLASLAHSISLLKFHGIGPFFSTLRDFKRNLDDEKQGKKKYARQIADSADFVKAMDYMRLWSNNIDFIGHPKLQYLREVVLNHFLDAGEGQQNRSNPPRPTRVMVFASYRDSTDEICRVLKRNEPMVRPHVFVGQAASKGSEGMDQKKQNAVIQDFKSGKYNTLVATSIGEEGLDIGDVDLIVCYDASSSPIRMLQRIGRTGRKRVGKVVLLLMRGKEENDYAKAQDNYAYIQKTIGDASRYTYHDDQSPRIVPKEMQPVVEKRIIDIPVENSQPIDLNEKRKRKGGRGKAKKPAKKFHMPDGVRTGFVSASKLHSDDESDDNDGGAEAKRKPVVKRQTKPKKALRLPAPDAAQVPYLDDVLLDSAQQRDHERRYARTADADESAVVQAPDASQHLESMRSLGQTRFIRHGRAAIAISQALCIIHDADISRMERLQTVRKPFDTELQIGTRARLVSPDNTHDASDAELPEQPVTTVRGKKAITERSNAAATRCKTSHGSDAMEGTDSSPEPTPADMRIGTQGIDLGSRDTSGEDEDEEHDSELDGFVVGSDQPIEMLSSSLPRTQDSDTVRLPARRKRRLVKRGAPTLVDVDEIDSDSQDDNDMGRSV